MKVNCSMNPAYVKEVLETMIGATDFRVLSQEQAVIRFRDNGAKSADMDLSNFIYPLNIERGEDYLEITAYVLDTFK